MFNLPELLRTIAEDYGDRGCEITYDGTKHVTFQGQPVALKRTFENLVDNAVQGLARADVGPGDGSRCGESPIRRYAGDRWLATRTPVACATAGDRRSESCVPSAWFAGSSNPVR
jgi:hypothetical protein